MRTVVLGVVMYGVGVGTDIEVDRVESPTGAGLWLGILAERKATQDSLTKLPFIKHGIFEFKVFGLTLWQENPEIVTERFVFSVQLFYKE